MVQKYTFEWPGIPPVALILLANEQAGSGSKNSHVCVDYAWRLRDEVFQSEPNQTCENVEAYQWACAMSNLT